MKRITTKNSPMTLVALLLGILLLISGGASVAAAALPLSPAIDCIAAEEQMVMVKSGELGKDISFTAADFRRALGVSNLKSITVTSLPAAEEGVLKLASLRVTEGQVISASNLGLLKFCPASALVTESRFTFTSGHSGGGDITCNLKIRSAKNTAPVIYTDDSLPTAQTQEGISLCGSLFATDDEGDALTFLITEYPSHGSLFLTDEKNGNYRYTPTAGYTGKDSFSFTVRDTFGNYSEEETVHVRVVNRISELVYADMENNDAYNAALVLTNAHIMQGRLSGDGMYFDPEETVTRADFLVMAMKAAGISANGHLRATCFDDNEEIADSLVHYVATAHRLGYVNGSFEQTGLYFRPGDPITRAEAAVILSNVMGLKDDGTISVIAADSDVPVWAEGAISTLYSMGIYGIDSEVGAAASSDLSRAAAANMLYAVLQYTDS